MKSITGKYFRSDRFFPLHELFSVSLLYGARLIPGILLLQAFPQSLVPPAGRVEVSCPFRDNGCILHLGRKLFFQCVLRAHGVMNGHSRKYHKKDVFYGATVTVPLMNGWMVHMYVYVPVWLNVNWNVSPWWSRGELSTAGDGATEVTV